MRKYGLSDQVRAVARDKYVLPALRDGKTILSIPVRSVLEELEKLDFPANSTPLVCNALRSSRFLGEELEVTAVDGPPSKLSTPVVVHYRVRGRGAKSTAKQIIGKSMPAAAMEESAEARAKRLTGKLKGLLKEELRDYGGGEAFLKWIRTEDEGAA
jgi:hypothetical protein